MMEYKVLNNGLKMPMVGLGVYKGVVRSVIEVRSWKWTLIAEDGTKFKRERCIFEGNLLPGYPQVMNIRTVATPKVIREDKLCEILQKGK